MTSQVNFFVLLSCFISPIVSVSIPPIITMQSEKDIYYKVNETVKITCEASGEPHPGFSWKRHGIDFNPAGNDDRITQIKNNGTLIINSPEDKDEGIYQCFAKNNYGTAVSIKFNLRMAKLDTFKNEDPVYHRVQLGDYLKMSCQSPDSVPDSQIYWVIVQKDGSYTVLDWNSTISMDYEDQIHFAHVTKDNHQSNRPYRCIAYNSMVRSSEIGPPQYVIPEGSSDQRKDVNIAWPKSRFNQFGLVGSTKNLKCIFSGNPTPIVRWRRSDNKPFPQRRVVTANSDGQELTISDLQFDDAGSYVCEASAEGSGSPLQMSFNLAVNSRPTWVKQPKDLETGEGATAIFECVATGVPAPQVFWFVNGEKLEEALASNTRLDGRFRRVEPTKIMLEDVTKEDSMVFQCNATNVHGYVWGQAYLNVLNEAPSILEEPEPQLKVAEKQPFEVKCAVAGKPDPIITWFKNDIQITGGRYIIRESGNLYVAKAVLSDAGLYRCEAVNKFGSVSNKGSVIVRRKTLIEQPPMDLEVTARSYAKFICSGTTDPEEINNLQVIWLKDFKAIDIGDRFFKNLQDNSLILSGAQVRDTGTFTCVLTNGLDNDTASARLEVTDVPDRPGQVSINKTCKAKGQAELSWMPGSFNNAPFHYHTVEYITTKDKDNWVFGTKVNGSQAKAFVDLNPGLEYKFRVISVNKIGASQPSPSTTTQCTTQIDNPLRNPTNVRTIGDQPGKIHLEWTPVPPIYHGGSQFAYSIIIKRVGEGNSSIFHKEEINDWRKYSSQIVAGGVNYQAFQISMKSINEVGDCKEGTKTIIGHSAEALPRVRPSNLQATDVTMDSVHLQWDFPRSEIGKISTKVNGEFNGFQIHTWEEGRKQLTVRQWMFSAKEFANQQGDKFNTTIHHMLPNSKMEATVAVMNNFFVGPPSDIISFRTLPGLPGPVSFMEDKVIAENHITIRWERPLDDRADIIGYDIGYQQVRRGLELGEMQERQPQINDPFTSTAMLDGLLPLTKYRIYIWARTVSGRGEANFIERSTGSPADLEIPYYTISGKGKDFINISWWKDEYKKSSSIVFVQYKKEDGAEWFSTTPDVTKSWVEIRMLQPGMTYQVRVVATNGHWKKISVEEDVKTDDIALAYDVVGNLGWFLGIIFSLLLHIGLIILFIICYKRGFRFNPLTSEDQTYNQGSQAFTGTPYYKDRFRERSEDFGPEPKGHTNDYYDDKDSYEYEAQNRNNEYQDFDPQQGQYGDGEKPPPEYYEYEDYKYDNNYGAEQDYPNQPGAYSGYGDGNYQDNRYNDDDDYRDAKDYDYDGRDNYDHDDYNRRQPSRDYNDYRQDDEELPRGGNAGVDLDTSNQSGGDKNAPSSTFV